MRAGLHTGEIEMRGDDVGGLAVHAASRVMSLCEPGEVLVSRVVTELTAGAGLKFSERGARDLKGLPGAPAVGERFRAEATLVRGGKRQAFAEARLMARKGETEALAATAAAVLIRLDATPAVGSSKL